MTLVTALCRRNRQHVSEALSGLLDMLQAIVIDYIALEKYDQQPEQLSQMPVSLGCSSYTACNGW
jgi:hypothetical protein